ncbi:MAG: hypothetical protein FJ215_04495 [Ignavibacteria bacterium]|nr:hypothetical protein [Ignavibacteria bacterium]
MNSSRHTVLIIAAAILVGLAYGGDRSNVRGVGMARTGNETARGFHALGINPANLAIPERGSVSFGLFSVGVNASSNLLSYEIYNNYFTGVPDGSGGRAPKYLTSADKEKILDAFPDGSAATKIDVEYDVLGFGVRTQTFALGFTTRERMVGRVDVSRDFARLFLFGLDSTGSSYVFNETNVSAYWWREYNLSYAMRLPLKLKYPKDILVGLSVKLLRGYGAFLTERYNASIANERIGTNQYRASLVFDYLTKRSGIDLLHEERDPGFSFFPEPAGTGVGVDLGYVAHYGSFSIHGSITDYGSIEWSRNVVETYGSYNLTIEDPFEEVNEDSVEQAFKGKNRKGSVFSTDLPTVLRVGVMFDSDSVSGVRRVLGSFSVALGYTQGLNSSMGNTTRPRFALGIEHRLIPFLPVRTGISLGGKDGFRWSAGFSLDLTNVTLDVGTENAGMLFSPHSYDMLSIAAGMSMRF